MGHQPHGRRHGGAVAQATECGGCLLQAEAQPVHAAVDFEPGGERPIEASGLEHPQLARLVDRDLEAVLRAERQLVGLEYALQEQDRLRRPASRKASASSMQATPSMSAPASAGSSGAAPWP